ncbi:hypothetical protein, partial [Klebsiella pneumoniae]|uniref:hypothetical protein n=1 Tax=Klebsiella pneumoniae TaxID=573 RepID=UPI001BE0A65D
MEAPTPILLIKPSLMAEEYRGNKQDTWDSQKPSQASKPTTSIKNQYNRQKYKQTYTYLRIKGSS